MSFVGPVMEADVKAGLRAIAAQIPAGATLALVQPACGLPDGGVNQRNSEWSRWAREELGARPNVMLIDIDRSIHSPGEHVPDMGDHFDRIVYYRVAEEIMGRVTTMAEAAE